MNRRTSKGTLRSAAFDAVDTRWGHHGGGIASPFAEDLHSMVDADATIVGLLAQGARSRAGSTGGGKRTSGLLTEEELRALEAEHEGGITAVSVIELFVSRGVRFSEATFRKYVQQGLLPRSRRVGRKGKNRGSLGVYPAKTVRRINAIKQLMADGYTIEEIQGQFLRYTDAIESIEEGLRELLQRLEQAVADDEMDDKARRALQRELGKAEGLADELMRRVSSIAQGVAAKRGDQYRSSGAAGSAEDLL